MVRPSRPAHQDTLPSCQECGAPTFMDRMASPPRSGDTSPHILEVRKCTKPECATHPENANHRGQQP